MVQSSDLVLIALGILAIIGVSTGFASKGSTTESKQIVETAKPISIRNQLIDFQIKKTSKGLSQDEFAQLEKLATDNPKIVKNLKAEFSKPPVKIFVTPKILSQFGIKVSAGDKPENLQRELLARIGTKRF